MTSREKRERPLIQVHCSLLNKNKDLKEKEKTQILLKQLLHRHHPFHHNFEEGYAFKTYRD